MVRLPEIQVVQGPRHLLRPIRRGMAYQARPFQVAGGQLLPKQLGVILMFLSVQDETYGSWSDSRVRVRPE